jgi:peptidoglycan/LPS O-acetylase OafA/YrhL
MIQRIQSVYLLLGALAMGGMLFLSALWSGPAAQQFGWFAPVAASLAGLTAAGALGTIFLYRNRKRQRAGAAGLQVLAALVTVLVFVAHYAAGALNLRASGGEIALGKAALLALPIVAYGLFLLARRAIQSDIELVQSMDRLR